MTTADRNDRKTASTSDRTPDAQTGQIVSILIARNRRATHASTEQEQALTREIERCKLDIHHAENVLAGAKYRLAMTEAARIARGDIQ